VEPVDVDVILCKVQTQTGEEREDIIPTGVDKFMPSIPVPFGDISWNKVFVFE
jgi:hypothetical protein